MRILHELAGLLAAAILAAVAAAFAAASLSADRWAKFCAPEQWNRPAIGLAAAGGLILVAVYVVSGLVALTRRRYHTLWKDGGTVSISMGAIAAQLLKLEEEYPAILRLRPCVRSHRNLIDVAVEVQVVEGTDIHELGESLQNRIRQRLTESLGLSDVRRVDVQVRHVQSPGGGGAGSQEDTNR
jgi:hypothetical protein